MPAGNNLGSCYLWKNFASAGARINEWGVYVPYEKDDDGTVRYSEFMFRRANNGTTGPMHLCDLRLSLPALTKFWTALTEVGTWSTTTDATRIPGAGTTRWSNTAGDYLEGTIQGHTLWVRGYLTANGGFAIIKLDGSDSAAKGLPQVLRTDFYNVNGATNNGDGTWTFTTSENHPFATGATIKLESLGGLTGANATHQNITVLSATSFKVTATITGSYTGGGLASYFGIANLGNRYISSYDPVTQYGDEWFLVAEGLTAGDHTIRITPLGTAYGGGGSTAQRAYITGIAGAAASTAIGTANVDFGPLREITAYKVAGSQSAFVSAVEYAPTADPNNYIFTGEIHGAETELTSVFKVDGVLVDPPLGTYTAGTLIELARTGYYTHTATGSTQVATDVAQYTARAGQYEQLVAKHKITWKNAGRARAAYHGMLPVAVREHKSAVLRQQVFTRALVGDTLLDDITLNNDTQRANHAAQSTEFFSTDHDFRARMFMPDVAKNVNNWRQSTVDFAWMQDRSDGVDKTYFSRSTSNALETIAVNDVHDAETGWSVWRQRSTDGPFIVPASRLENDAFGVGRKEADAQLNQETVAAAGTTPSFLARIVNRRNCAALDPLQIKSVSYSIVEKLESNPSYSRAVATNVVVQPYECLFATLQTDCAWGGLDSTGYNFKLIPAAGALPSSGYTYVVTVTLTPRSGPAFQIRYRVRTI